MARTARPSANAAPANLTQAQRHERIAEIVLREDFVSLKDLAARLDVSLMTVHRDLDALERQGVLRKVRGGATPQPSSLFESNVRYRLTQALPEKHSLARAALALVEPQMDAEQLGADESKIVPTARFTDDLNADSLDLVEMIMSLEEEFGVEIPDDAAEKITTVKDAISYIDEHKA